MLVFAEVHQHCLLFQLSICCLEIEVYFYSTFYYVIVLVLSNFLLWYLFFLAEVQKFFAKLHNLFLSPSFLLFFF